MEGLEFSSIGSARADLLHASKPQTLMVWGVGMRVYGLGCKFYEVLGVLGLRY